jgi:hypothetical protein
MYIYLSFFSLFSSFLFYPQMYIAPLRNSMQNGRGILNEEDLKRIFSTVELIYNLNNTLLQDLRERIKKWSDSQIIGDVFLVFVSLPCSCDPLLSLYLLILLLFVSFSFRLFSSFSFSLFSCHSPHSFFICSFSFLSPQAPMFKLYSDYVKNYAVAMVHLQFCTEKYSKFAQFLKDAAVANRQVLGIHTFLIMPVQRLPRYILLLNVRDVLSSSSSSSSSSPPSSLILFPSRK